MRAAVCALVLSACSTRSAYQCTSSDQCVSHGAQGTCEQSYCAFPDSTCASGLRFEPNAGGGLANQCATQTLLDAPLADVPQAPIAFVQANAVRGGAVTTMQVVFVRAIAPRDAILLGVDSDSPGLVTVSDTEGNTYVPVVGPVTASGYSLTLFVALDVAGGPDTVTVTWSSPVASECHLYAHEYAGLTSFDVGAGGVGTSTATDGITSGMIETHHANELVFGYTKTGIATAGTGFTARSTFDNNITEDESAPAPGPYQATATMTNGTSWTMLVGAFRGP